MGKSFLDTIDWEKILSGKVFSGSERRCEFKEGRNQRFYVKIERPLVYQDVSGVKVNENNVIFTTFDGKKYVEKIVFKGNVPESTGVKSAKSTGRRVKREGKLN